MDIQYLPPPLPVRDRNDDLAVKPPGPPEGRVKGVGDICRGDHDDLAPVLEPVHDREELGDYPAFYLLIAADILAFGGDGINFINKYDGRRIFLGF